MGVEDNSTSLQADVIELDGDVNYTTSLMTVLTIATTSGTSEFTNFTVAVTVIN
jgi:DUF4097 and DUF4098 domain-containing protein YvlB